MLQSPFGPFRFLFPSSFLAPPLQRREIGIPEGWSCDQSSTKRRCMRKLQMPCNNSPMHAWIYNIHCCRHRGKTSGFMQENKLDIPFPHYFPNETSPSKPATSWAKIVRGWSCPGPLSRQAKAVFLGGGCMCMEGLEVSLPASSSLTYLFFFTYSLLSIHLLFYVFLARSSHHRHLDIGLFVVFCLDYSSP